MRSNQATIRDQSCLNPIEIESKMQGDHKELKIMLQNCLISSRFNQELSRRREYIDIYKKIPCEKCQPFDLMKIGWTATIVCVG